MSESFSLRLQGGKVFAEGEARTTIEFVHAQRARMQIVTWKSFPSSPAGNSLRRRGLAWGGMHPQDVVPTHRNLALLKRAITNLTTDLRTEVEEEAGGGRKRRWHRRPSRGIVEQPQGGHRCTRGIRVIKDNRFGANINMRTFVNNTNSSNP